MSGLFRGLQIGISTLMAHQRAIDVTSQNIANVNTPLYQRQRVDLHELSGPSGTINPPLMGSGVYVKGISRYVTPFLDQQLRHQRSLKQYAEETETMLLDIESALTEPSEFGIAAHLDSFWQAWQDLTVTPTEQATRIALLQTASQLTAGIQEAYSYIEAMAANLTTQIETSVNRINDIASEIQGLNKEILRANALVGEGSGAIPLEQRRDALLFELADLVDFTATTEESGLTRVIIGSYALVDDSGAHTIELDDGGDPVWSNNQTALQVGSGKLKALMDMRDETVPSILGDLDELALGLIANVNDRHRDGYGTDGITGINFFEGQNAKTIAVNPLLFTSPESIATAGAPNSIGDISVALAIVDLATERIMGNGSQVSINGFYRSLVTDLGMQVQQSRAAFESSRLVFEHLSDRRQSISGVSMDEEVANLLTYEKAFQAGARIINVVDEMLDQVINRMGLVGR